MVDKIALPEIIDIHNVSLLHEMLVKTPVENPLVIHAESVTRITTPGIQVLISLGRSLEQKNQSFSLGSVSPAVREAFADLGLSSLLEQWSKHA